MRRVELHQITLKIFSISSLLLYPVENTTAARATPEGEESRWSCISVLFSGLALPSTYLVTHQQSTRSDPHFYLGLGLLKKVMYFLKFLQISRTLYLTATVSLWLPPNKATRTGTGCLVLIMGPHPEFFNSKVRPRRYFPSHNPDRNDQMIVTKATCIENRKNKRKTFPELWLCLSRWL
jgi:hypothetical protein